MICNKAPGLKFSYSVRYRAIKSISTEYRVSVNAGTLQSFRSGLELAVG